MDAPRPDLAAPGVRRLASVGSTNDVALAAARDGEAGPLWIVAERQTAGRGRAGRNWVSPPGNLHASLLLTDPCPPARAARLGFLAGLALHEAAAEATGLASPRLALKWPNDLLLDGAKCAGVMAEGTTVAGRFRVVLGFGVNVAAAPEDLPYPATALGPLAPGLDAAGLFTALARAFAATWTRHGPDPTVDAAFARLREAWTSRAAFIGAPVRVAAPGGFVEGIAEGLDAEGRLVLAGTGGRRAVEAGDLLGSIGAPQRRATTRSTPILAT